MSRIALAIGLLVAFGAGSLATLVVRGHDEASVDVRVTAQRLPNGTTELALQQRGEDGWSDRILPASRFIPVAPATGRWLSSSVVRVTAPTPKDRLAAYEDVVIGEEIVVAMEDFDGPRGRDRPERSLYYGTNNSTWVVRVAATDDDLYDRMRLVVRCNDGELDVYLSRLPVVGVTWRNVSYQLDGENSVIETWARDGYQTLRAPNDARLMSRLKAADSLMVAVTHGDADHDVVTATFDLQDMFDTPIQGNLDYCGEY